MRFDFNHNKNKAKLYPSLTVFTTHHTTITQHTSIKRWSYYNSLWKSKIKIHPSRCSLMAAEFSHRIRLTTSNLLKIGRSVLTKPISQRPFNFQKVQLLFGTASCITDLWTNHYAYFLNCLIHLSIFFFWKITIFWDFQTISMIFLIADLSVIICNIEIESWNWS